MISTILHWKIFRTKWVAVGWLLFITLLFFLPGSAFPRENFLTKIYLDKWIHAGLFGALLFMWRSSFNYSSRYYTIMLLLAAFIYGIAVEIVQKNWVPNRDFDLYDVAADMTGALLGLLIWREVYKKNKPL